MANSVGYHEPLEKMSHEAVEMHRALTSLQEELEAVDWYRQRADACEDEALTEILLHNMREEIEHASMILEWLRRNSSDFDKQLKMYLFTDAPITEVEEIAMSGGGQDSDEGFTVGKP
ncbi:MAG: encapsulin-associated ferritin-like protein [Gammaproteobacteria bacterium]